MSAFRQTAALLVFVISVALLAGCTKSDVQDSVKSKVNFTSLELNVYYPNEADFKQVFTVKAFQDKYPNVTFKQIPQLDVELTATGMMPDIVFYPDLVQVQRSAKDGNIEDLSEWVKKYNVDLNRFEPNLIKNIKLFSDGKLYALPKSRAVHALYYNKDIFDRFGVPYPSKDKPMTWEETIDLARKMTRMDGSVQYRGMDTGFLPLLLQQLSASPLDPASSEPRYSSDPKFKMFLEKVKAIFDVPGMFPGDDKTKYIRSNFVNFQKEKNVAMIALWDATVGVTAMEQEGTNVDLAPFPVWKEYPGINPIASAHHFSMGKTSKNKDIVMEFFQAFFTDEHQTQLSRDGVGLSPLINKEINKGYKQGVKELANKNIGAFFINMPADMTPPLKYEAADLNVAFRDIALGKGDINTILRNLDEAAVKKVMEQKIQQ